MRRNRELRRRDFLSTFLVFTAACGSESDEAKKEPAYMPTSCDDYKGLEESDIELRKGFGYVETSPIEESHCMNCKLYKPALEGQICGGCTLFKGPVFETGYCTYWAPNI